MEHIDLRFKDLNAQASLNPSTQLWTCRISEIRDGMTGLDPICILHLDNVGAAQVAATLISTMNFLANKDKQNE